MEVSRALGSPITKIFLTKCPRLLDVACPEKTEWTTAPLEVTTNERNV
jgi:hypothetical protein